MRDPESREQATQKAAEAFVLPASFAQQRLWFHDQMVPGSPVYNVPTSLRMRGPLDVAALEQSLDEVVRRHEVLRTSVASLNGEPVQIIAPERRGVLAMIDLGELPSSAHDTEALRLAVEEARRPFDLARGPLFRATLLRLHQDEHVLLLTIHHIISDGWSTPIFLDELTTLYDAFASGRPSPLPPLPIQYGDYAIWQRDWLQGEVLERQLSYWRERLAGAPTLLVLPTDRPRPAIQSFAGARESFAIPEDLRRRLSQLSQREGVTPFMTLLAAFQTLLLRYTGQDDIVVGTPIAGRRRTETEGLIGFFANTLIVRTDLSGDPTFRELLGRVRETTIDAYAHQDTPFEKIVEALQPERSLSHNPIFQVLFALKNTRQATLKFAGVSVERLVVEEQASGAAADIEVLLQEQPGSLTGTVVYNTDLFDRAAIQRMIGHFQVLLTGVVSDSGQRLSKLPILSESERNGLLADANPRGAPLADTRCIHRVFEAQVERAPTETALVFRDERISFDELNRRANRLARYLIGEGIGPETLVGVCLERSIEMVVSLLAVLKAGGAYVPLDPSYPTERLEYMLSDAQCRLLLTQEGLLDRLPATTSKVICLDRNRSATAGESDSNPVGEPSQESLAYVMYTSGSTGRPKGVLVCHRGVVSLLEALRSDLDLGPSDVWTNFHSFAFDFSVWEIWGCLLHGGRLVIVPAELTRNPEGFHDLLEKESITVLNQTPSSLSQLVPVRAKRERKARPFPVRIILSGGEALPRDLAARVLEWGIPFWNLYGPTEATVWAAINRVTDLEGKDGFVSIGRSIANARVYVLDDALEPQPVGVPGELYIGGSGVARGYRNRPDLTRERFVPDPFSGTRGGLLYRSGDQVRMLPDRTLDFLGRLDQQVKIRGYRVELGEIEAVLKEQPGVREAVAVVRPDSAGESRLVAYLVADQDVVGDLSSVRASLRTRLPEYMLPGAIVFIDALPLTHNGKLDRRGLPAPDFKRSEREHFVSPRTSTEKALAEIWETLLGIDRVSARDNFFELGGHSLLATRLVTRIAESLHVVLPVRRVFEHPTLEALSAAAAELPKNDREESLLELLAEVRGLTDEEAERQLLSETQPERDRGRRPGGP